MLPIIYTILLGLLCACFVECGIYAFLPAPKQPVFRPGSQAGASPVEQLRHEDDLAVHQDLAEKHSIKHYVVALLASTVQAAIALSFRAPLGVLADGILLGSVFTLGTGTVFGIAGGGRLARFAVATVSLLSALVLGAVEFLPHRVW